MDPLTARQLNRAVHAAAAARHRQARDHAHAAPLLRHPPAGAEGRHPRDPGAAGPQEAGDHIDLRPGGHRPAARGDRPAGRSCSRRAPSRPPESPVGRPALEVADIFREHGPAWREAQRGHLSLAQLKVMSAITQCRTAALGGHVLRCDGCGTDQIAYNSCRNRHCPKCQSSGGPALARCAAGRSAAGGVLPRGLHAAGADRRHRVPEQGRALRPAVRRGRRDAADHRGRPEAPGRAHRRHAGAAHLGLGADAPPARARHRARRRAVARRQALGRLPAGVLPAGARAVAAVPAALPRRAAAAARGRQAAVLRRARGAGRRRRPSRPGWRRCASASGWSTPSGRSPGRRRCWPTCRATRTAWPSPTAGCSRWTSAA